VEVLLEQASLCVGNGTSLSFSATSTHFINPACNNLTAFASPDLMGQVRIKSASRTHTYIPVLHHTYLLTMMYLTNDIITKFTTNCKHIKCETCFIISNRLTIQQIGYIDIS
jgi:hypothetical protein